MSKLQQIVEDIRAIVHGVTKIYDLETEQHYPGLPRNLQYQ